MPSIVTSPTLLSIFVFILPLLLSSLGKNIFGGSGGFETALLVVLVVSARWRFCFVFAYTALQYGVSGGTGL